MTKAITLHQPWASLIALGVKTIETRSWKPPAALIGERLLIHAGARDPDYGPLGDWMVCSYPGFPMAGTAPGPLLARTKVPGVVGYCGLPLGAIVASCILADAIPMVEAGTVDALTAMRLRSSGALVVNPDGPEMAYYHPQMADDEMSRDASDQRPYGDFAPGRWAWFLEDVKPTTERCPACWLEVDPEMYASDWDIPRPDCDYCGDEGYTDPLPAKGHQRIWSWTP